jgi:hypothetical protein
LACKSKQSGQGAWRNGRKPDLHNGVPGVERFNDKRKYYKKKKTLQSSIVELTELTKDWIEWTPEELKMWADQDWHELDEWDVLTNDTLPDTLGEGLNG